VRADRRIGALFSGRPHRFNALCEHIERPRFYAVTQSPENEQNGVGVVDDGPLAAS
jgi:hypothetical protein